MEKNPLKIIYLARSSLLPTSVWIFFLMFVISLVITTFAIPKDILLMNYKVFDTNQFLIVSLSALTFILSMYMFGREVYTTNDFAQLYSKNSKIYYGYLADYLFPALLWSLVSFLSICKLIIVVTISDWLLDLLRVVFISLVSLSVIATITLVTHNMNRVDLI